MHRYTTPSVASALSAATAKTLIQLVTGATRRASITGFTLGFSSVTASDAPVLCELLLQTTAGTASAATPQPDDQADPAAIVTAQNTVTRSLRHLRSCRFLLTPVAWLIICDLEAMGKVLRMLVSTRVGFRVTSPAAQSNAWAELWHQE
jgi:ABC-type phosphate transport system permease subunit